MVAARAAEIKMKPAKPVLCLLTQVPQRRLCLALPAKRSDDVWHKKSSRLAKTRAAEPDFRLDDGRSLAKQTRERNLAKGYS